MAFEGSPISNHCSNASVWGWYRNTSCFSRVTMGTVEVPSTSTASPVSRLAWHVAGIVGYCQVGTILFPKGSFNASEVSCDKAVTSWIPGLLKIPGEIQVAKA